MRFGRLSGVRGPRPPLGAGAPERKGGYAASVFLSLYLFALVNSTLGALLTDTIEHYGLSDSQQGISVTMLNAGCIAALVSSLWVTRRARKPTLIWIAALATAALLLPLSIPPPFAVFSALFLLIGVAVGYTDTLSSSSIADLYAGDGRRSALMMCMLHAVFGFAGIVSPLAYRAMIGNGLAWHHIYAVLCGVGACFLAYIAPKSIKKARAEPASNSGRASSGDLRGYLADRGRAMILLAMFLYGAFLSSTTVWIERFVSVGLGGGGLGALSLSLFWLGLTASRLISPLLKIQPTALVRYSCFASAVMLAAGILSGDAALMCACAAVAGLSCGAIIPLLLHISCGEYPSNTLIATTLPFLALYLAQSVFPPVMGMLDALGGLTLAMALCPAMALGCGIAALFMRTGSAKA